MKNGTSHFKTSLVAVLMCHLLKLYVTSEIRKQRGQKLYQLHPTCFSEKLSFRQRAYTGTKRSKYL